MSTVDTIQIAVNRYAPEGSNAINLYATSTSTPLTIGQLVQAVCLNAAAAYETQSVLKMNTMNTGTVKLDQAATWLSRIAINESLDFMRRQKNLTLVSADDANLGVADRLMADDYFDGDETQAQLQEAIASLPDVQRTVFQLRYFDEMKYSEISRLLDTSEGALKASYHIAVKKITEFFHSHD